MAVPAGCGVGNEARRPLVVVGMKSPTNRTEDAKAVTPDGRYLIVRGRLWRTADPGLPEAERKALVDTLMAARRGVRAALASGDGTALAEARAAVDTAKRALGERGAVWWTDGAPDQNRRMVRNSSYAQWYAEVHGELP